MTDIPELPREYVDRVKDQQEIGRLLEDPGTRVAIHGLPGVGKTALAAKLAESVRDDLGLDRVLWADLGQEPDPVDVLRRWCQDDVLRGWRPELDAEIAGAPATPPELLTYLRARLSEAVSGRRVLFVLDDVGSSAAGHEAAAACLINDDSCRCLVTTISAATAGHLRRVHGFTEYHVDQLEAPEAARVLERYAGGQFSLDRLTPAERAKLLRLGDGLPLGLMVLGRFLDVGLDEGDQLSWLLARLDNAEALVQQPDVAIRLHAAGAERGSIDAILLARWLALPPEQQVAVQTAAVFREKPHSFEENAWACVLAARQASPPDVEEPAGEEPEAPGELAQRLGGALGLAENNPDFTPETEGTLNVLALARSAAHAQVLADEDLKDVVEAVGNLQPLRAALMKTGLLEQPMRGEASFTMHSAIGAFLRTVHLLHPDETAPLDRHELMRVHDLAAGYYRGWLGGYQDNHATGSPYAAAYRYENQQWLSATLDLCYHLREAGAESKALIALTTLFFDAFWWWGELVPYPMCEELLRMWQLANTGPEATRCLAELRQFYDNYPALDHLGQVPSTDQKALPRGYQDASTAAAFQAVGQAVVNIREQVLEGVVGDVAAARDHRRLRMVTDIYLGEADRMTGQFARANDNYQEALRLLEELGASAAEEEEASDDWFIPYVHCELADLHVRAGDPVQALAACDAGTRAAVGADGALLGETLDDIGAVNEPLGWLWQAAGDAHWQAGRLKEAWSSYAWACFHACTCMFWPQRIVLYEHRGGRPQRVKEWGVDDYTVMFYKLTLKKLLDRLQELWDAQRRDEASAGIRTIRETLDGGLDRPGPNLLEGLAATRPDAAWADIEQQAWQDTGLHGLALPLIPWERLTRDDGQIDEACVRDQNDVAAELAERLEMIWSAHKWAPGDGPGQSGLPSSETTADNAETDRAGTAP